MPPNELVHDAAGSRIVMDAIGYVSCDADSPAEVPSEGLPSDVVVFDQYVPAIEGIEAWPNI